MKFQKIALLITLVVMAFSVTGCLGSATRQHLKDKTEWAREKSKNVVEENIDEIVVEILKKLDERLQARSIELPQDLKDLVVAEAQQLARKYAMKGVDKIFDELQALIDRTLASPKPKVIE